MRTKRRRRQDAETEVRDPSLDTSDTAAASPVDEGYAAATSADEEPAAATPAPESAVEATAEPSTPAESASAGTVTLIHNGGQTVYDSLVEAARARAGR